MSRTTAIAFTCTLLLSAVAIGDAVVFATTGVSLASDRYGGGSYLEGPVWERVVYLVHVLGYLAPVVVMLTVARPVFRGRPWRQVIGWITIVSMTVMGLAFLQYALLPDLVVGAVDTVLGIGFLVTLVVPGVLGAMMLVQGDRSPAAWLLAAAPLGLIAAFVLGAMGSPFAHPGYAEALAYCGLGLLGWRAAAPARGGSEVAAPAQAARTTGAVAAGGSGPVA